MRISPMMKTTMLAMAIAGFLCPAVMAQELQDRYYEIKKQYENDHPGKRYAKASVVQLYPSATRADPGLIASNDLIKPLGQLLALVNDDNNYDQAIATGEALAANSKANPYDIALIYKALGFAHVNKGDGARGVEYMQKSLQQNALSNNEQYTLMLQVANEQIAIRQADAGLATLARLVTETRQDKPEYDGVRGHLYYLKNDYTDAAQALQKSIDASGQADRGEQDMLLDSYFRLGQFERAQKVGEDIVHAHPDDHSAIMNLVAVYLKAGKTEKTLALLEDAHKRGLLTTADDYRTLYVLYSRMKGRENDSAALINEGLQKGILLPGEQVYTALAEDYFFTHQLAQAIDAYKEADDASADGEAALNLAKLYRLQGRMADASSAANRALQKGVKHREEAHALVVRDATVTSKP